MENVEVHDMSELLGDIAKNGGRCTKWRNPAAQDMMAGYRKNAVGKLNETGKRIALKVIIPQAIDRVTGLKGAISLIKRVTGQDHSHAMPYEDDSELGIYIQDGLYATGIQAKIDRINDLYGHESIRLDMITDYNEAIGVVDGFKHQVNIILAEPPTVVQGL